MISVESIYLGKYENKDIYRYILKNDNDFEVHILNLGGIINKILTKNKKNEKVNVVLGYDFFEKYVSDPSYAGAIIGPTSGRIDNGIFKINDVQYNLEINSGEHANHGGKGGLTSKVFEVEEIEYKDMKGVELSYSWKNLEAGHPGNMKFYIRYFINDKSTLKIEFYAMSDRKSYVNMTNHSYFNLSGNLSENGDSQYLMINSDKFCEVKSNMIPNGKLIDVKNSAFDFKKPTIIKENIDKGSNQFNITRAIDHGFVLNKDGIDATLYSKSSGIKMSLKTSQNVLVVYTGNYLDDVIPFDNVNKNTRYMGIALEAQNYQNGINIEEFDSKLTTPVSPYYEEIEYIFSVE